MKKVSILIVDDHPVYRDALAEKFHAEFGSQQFSIVLAADAKEGIAIVESSDDRHWTVILDVQLPGLSGKDAIAQFKQRPSVKHVVAISGLDEHAWRDVAISSGASSFISKNNTGQFICDQVKVLLHMPADSQISPHTAAKEFRFTNRQKDVLKCMANGHPNKIIAELLAISEQTVKIHIGQIFRELKVTNRMQAVLKAQKYRLI
jgi:DNA-binding NarL/FixJ family response regulator